jgi:hypothetical protein
MLNLNVSKFLTNLDHREVLRVVNSARPPSSYLFAKYLPERQEVDFDIQSATIRVVPTMAGVVGMDSPYPEGGAILSSRVTGEIAKMAIQVSLNERDKRKMYQMLLRLGNGAQSTQYMVTTLLNFADKVLGQSQLDRREWLRGRALIDHSIDWTFNSKNVKVDYGIDSKYRLTARTGNDGYGGSASKFWADITSAKKLLKYRVAAIIAHPDTWEMVRANSVNKARVINLNEETGDMEIVRVVGTTETSDTDPTYRVKCIAYGLEGSVYDPANPEAVVNVPFINPGEIVVIGRGVAQGFNVGAAAVDEGATPNEVKPLGYHHIAPTDEGGYALGDWGRIYTPDNAPNKIIGQSVSNNMPVLEADNQVVRLKTDMV